MSVSGSGPAARPLTNDRREPAVLPWEEGRSRIADARYYWLGTVHPSGRPQVRPVLAVWDAAMLYTTSSPDARKGRNLDHDGRCTVAVSAEDMHLVLEGTASTVTDDAVLQRIARAYRTKYDWPVTVRDGLYDAPYGAPTAGPPPYRLYEIRPSSVFAFVNDSRLAGASSTRFSF
jgi:Pyridoxamine 5'-phosphate oxidase